jgi:hypothetical protein
MHKKNRAFVISTLIILGLFSLTFPIAAFAQTYHYSLPQQFIDVYWNEDGTSSIDYVFIFVNDPDGPTIEFVDVGVPNSNYDLNSVVAYADGNELSDIESSPYVIPGVAVGLGANSIPAGDSGEVRVFIGRVRDVLYPDDDDATYASAVFNPNFFEKGSISGSTDTILTYHLPPGVQPEEPRWHTAPPGFSPEPEGGIDDQGRITYTWRNSSSNATSSYSFGASFPLEYVDANSIVEDQPSGSAAGSISSFTDLIGCASPFIIPLLCFGGIAALVVWGVTADRRRKLKYLPPKISIEGHGIKRGLTAVEAGILMEQPMDKIMTMILFGVLKKNAAQVITRDPLDLEIKDPLPEKLHIYEKEFLLAFQQKKKVNRKKALQKMMVSLIKSVGKKMKGFSLKETIAYYKDITERAWVQVEAADTPEVKSQKYDEHMEWTMLDREYDDRTRDVFRTGPVFVPMWWPRYDPGYGRAAAGSARPSAPSTGSGPSMPTLPGSAFAGSVVTGVQSFSGSVVGSISDFTRSITNVTNPPPKPPASSYSRSGGGGGGGCACACACAGCACACAGGGR